MPPKYHRRSSSGTVRSQGNGNSTNSSSPSNVRHPVRPREEKILHRFFEPLVLLDALGDTRGERTQAPSRLTLESIQYGTLKEVQRNLLTSLACICDYEKGGDSVTAIAVEGTPQCTNFWIAANKNPKLLIRPFLQNILSLLRECTEASRPHLEERIFKDAVEFGQKRIDAYRSLMRKSLAKCIEILSAEGRNESKIEIRYISLDTPRLTTVNIDTGLLQWLGTICERDDLELCNYAFDNRKCEFMKELKRRGHSNHQEPMDGTSNAHSFQVVRHYLGRFGVYLRTAKIITSAAIKLPQLFDTFEVKVKDSSGPISFPPMDESTTLNGMATRMLARDSPELDKVQTSLAYMDLKFGILDKVRDSYQGKGKPRPHAEIILVEHFHNEKLEFLGNDRYIACSKPACYCCYHYICHHPGVFERPASHNKIYLNWAPPKVNHSSEGISQEQRHIMDKIIERMRGECLMQIKARSGPMSWRPDSTTGISHSIDLNRGHDPRTDVISRLCKSS
jgi:hypothetical protein